MNTHKRAIQRKKKKAYMLILEVNIYDIKNKIWF